MNTSKISPQLSLEYSSREKDTFIHEFAAYILKNHKDHLKDLTVIFPNRRAGLYFIRELASQAKTIGWGPLVYSLEEFYTHYSPVISADRYSLIFRLYSVYTRVYGSSETLDNFFFWGEMLLSDMDEVDRYLVSAKRLFLTLAEFKSLDQIDFLDDEQKDIISSFWKTVQLSKDPENWTSFWSKLGVVYEIFREELAADGIGYQGMILRELVENIEQASIPDRYFVFAGFNALSPAEEGLIEYFLKNKKSEILWDVDDYYLHGKHEAGKFFRKYRNNELFSRSINEISRDHLSDKPNIKIIGSGTWIGQLKIVGQLLYELSNQESWREESTVVVLPDEKLLLPLLNAIPETIDDVNVTMGIMLRYTSSYSLLENIIQLHKQSKSNEEGEAVFFYKNIINLLRHPIIQSLGVNGSEDFEKMLRKGRKLYYSSTDLKAAKVEPDLLFQKPQNNLVNHLAQVAAFLVQHAPNQLEKVFLNALHHHLSRLSTTLSDYKIDLNYDSLTRLFRQVAATGRIPFSGEPVKGLQIMGVFETRNLDFDNVFIVNLNEGSFPHGLHSQSFIPFTLRKAFKLPTFEDNQSIQSYLFYRLLQRSHRVHLIYNSIGDVIGGETSRFIHQLRFGKGFSPEFFSLKELYDSKASKMIGLGSSNHISRSLERYTNEESYLSPSAINTYITCSLKFYFKYIVRLRQDEEVEEGMDARVYGNLLHRSAEHLFRDFIGMDIEDRAQLDSRLERSIQQAFDETIFDAEGGVALLRKAILTKSLKKLIDFESKNLPLRILDVEPTYFHYITITSASGPKQIKIGGKLDRVDLSAGVLRIIDYKTGTDTLNYKDIDSLFLHNQTSKRKVSAIFQLYIYALLLKRSKEYNGQPIAPLLFSLRNVFNADFSPFLIEGERKSKAEVKDVLTRLNEFESKLETLLSQIFTDQKFVQTEFEDDCKYCEFSPICRREKATD